MLHEYISNDISLIRVLIIMLLPLLLVRYHVARVYNLSFVGVLLRRVFLFYRYKSSFTHIFMFIVFYALFTMCLGGVINMVYHGLFGQKQTVVYMGNTSKNVGVFYEHDDISQKTFSGDNHDRDYNFSFKDIYTKEHYLKGPGEEGLSGLPLNRVHYAAIFAALFLSLAFLFPLWFGAHVMSYQVYLEKYGDKTSIHGSTSDAFERVLGIFWMSSGFCLFVGLVSLGVGLFFISLVPERKIDPPERYLPISIKPRGIVEGLPVGLEIEYKSRKSNSGHSETYDTGFRFAIFEFKNGFSPPAYVSYYFESAKHPVLEKVVKVKIYEQQPLTVELDEELRIRPLYREAFPL